MKEPEHRFHWFLCKTYQKLPDDNWFEELDPMIKAWMFYSWIEDFADEFKLLENQGYLIGSFFNPEAVKKILGKGSETHTSTDEEFDKLTRKLMEPTEEELALMNGPKRKNKKRRKLKE